MNENWKFSDIPYTRPDVDALQSRYNELTSRARRASCAEELLQIVRERDALQQEVGLLQSIITIRAFHDVTDGFYQTEFQETLPRLETLDSQSLSIAILENPYASALDEIFEKNPYMQSICPGDTRSALEVIRLYEAAGEFFDIRDPAHIVRDSITTGQHHHWKGGAGSTGLLCRQGLHRLRDVHIRLSAEMHRSLRSSGSH